MLTKLTLLGERSDREENRAAGTHCIPDNAMTICTPNTSTNDTPAPDFDGLR